MIMDTWSCLRAVK